VRNDEIDGQPPRRGDTVVLTITAVALIAVVIVSITAPAHLESALVGLATLAASLNWTRGDTRR
jgi:hypothetical protein